MSYSQRSESAASTPQSSRTSSRSASPVASIEDAVETSRKMRAMLESDSDDDPQDDLSGADLYEQMKARLAAPKGQPPAKTDDQDTALLRQRNKSPISVTSLPHARHYSRSSPVHSTSSASDSDGPRVLSRKRARNGTRLSSPAGQNSFSSDSDSEDTLAKPVSGDRLQALIAKRRQERLDREAEDKARREEEDRLAASKTKDRDDLPEEVENAETRAIEDKLTQQARPTRKASKKAIEDMNRETQRMARNMQLTHQAKVKTRFSVADFAARFKGAPLEVPAASSSVAPSSDTEQINEHTTPPSSPPSESEGLDLGKSILSTATRASAPIVYENEDELPTFEEILKQALPKADKGKAPALEPAPVVPTLETKTRLPPRQYRVQPMSVATRNVQDFSDDDDLEVIKEKKRFAVFDTIQPLKASESKALHTLRMLAGLENQDQRVKGKKGQVMKPSMTAAQLDLQLLNRAAVQAQFEREQKIAELKAKGILVQTAEEREQDQLEIENMLEKAREQAEELRKKEKATAKAEGAEGAMEASDDESDDEWVEKADGSDGSEGEEAQGNDEEDELDMSGSEDEEEGEEEERRSNVGLVDDAADEADLDEDDEEAEVEDAAMEEAPTATPMVARHAASRRGQRRIVLDDEDEGEDGDGEVTGTQIDQGPATAPQDDLAAAFGFAAAPQMLIGPSQLFAGTMEPSQTQRLTFGGLAPSQEQDSMDLFNEMVPTMASKTRSQMAAADAQWTHPHADTFQSRVEKGTPREIDLRLSQDTPATFRFSQFSTVPSPSQDAGLTYQYPSLFMRPDVSQSTVETVPLGVPESPMVQKRGRLHSRRQIVDEEDVSSADEAVANSQPIVESSTSTAFEVMCKATKKKAKVAEYDKKKSEARNMIDENAEESEDEYAGLGGASDDDDGGEADEADRAMLDESDIRVDERKMAAFYAEKARAENEAQTTKLYKDLMTGALRRQRGDAFDLDSDEDDQLAERRRRKQREEARKRRLLLGDEKLGKFDGNDKKEAFLRAIEDRDELDDVDMLDGKDRDADEAAVNASQTEASQQPASQSQSGEEALRAVSGNVQKRKAADGDMPIYDGPFKRPTFAARRTNAAFVKPTSLAEVRESLSFLVDEPHAEPKGMIGLDDSDDEQHNAQPVYTDKLLGEPDDDLDADGTSDLAAPAVERAPFSARRTPATPAAVVDRLLLRQSSSSLSTSTTASGRGMAFLARSNTSMSNTNLPSLLRRATTNNNSSSTGVTGVAPPGLNRQGSSSTGTDANASGVRRQGGKKSSINYAVREAERRAKVEKVEQRRKDEVKRIAGMRGAVGGGSAGRRRSTGFGCGFE